MPLNTSDDWKGLLDIVNLSIFLASVDKAGLNHKFSDMNEDKRLALVGLGKKILLTEIPNATGLESYLTTPLVTTLNSHVNSLDLVQIQNMDTNLTPEIVKSLKANLDSYKSSTTTLGLISNITATSIVSITQAQNVLASINNVSILELIDPTTSIKFLYDNSFLDQTTYDSIIKNLKGSELNKLIAGLPGLSYISGITGLDTITIASFINPLNPDSNKCICNILSNFSGLEASINNVLDNIIPSIDLTQLNAIKLQFDSKIDQLQSEVTIHLNNITQIDNLITQANLAISSIPISDANCTNKLTGLVAMLSSIKNLYSTLIVSPILSQFNMLKTQVGQITDFANLVQGTLNFKVDLTC